jgi:hypothetical protein
MRAAVESRAVRAHAVLAALRLVLRVVAEVNQRVVALRSTPSPRRRRGRHRRPRARRAARTSLAGRPCSHCRRRRPLPNFGFIDEHGSCNCACPLTRNRIRAGSTQSAGPARCCRTQSPVLRIPARCARAATRRLDTHSTSHPSGRCRSDAPCAYAAPASGARSGSRHRSRNRSSACPARPSGPRPSHRRRRADSRSGFLRRYYHHHRAGGAVLTRKRAPLAGVRARYPRLHHRCRFFSAFAARRKPGARRHHCGWRKHAAGLWRCRRLRAPRARLRLLCAIRKHAKRDGTGLEWRPRIFDQRVRHPRGAGRCRQR